ncbi:MAG: BPSS1780 family membrane protein [Pseudomonadota bacterium]
MSRLTITRPPGTAGLAWLAQGWRLFTGGVIAWMGMAAMSLLTVMLIGSIPLVGSAVVELLSPFLVAGFMVASRAAHAGQPFSFYMFADGFRETPRQLAIVGAVYLAASLLAQGIMQALGGQGFQLLFELAQTRPDKIEPAQAELILSEALPAMALGLLLLTPALLATWFAPALILFDRFPPGKAMYWSLWACLSNWRPMLIYGLWLTLAAVVAMLIPFGLGLLVFVPVALASSYLAYRQIFVEAPPVEAEPVQAPAEGDA